MFRASTIFFSLNKVIFSKVPGVQFATYADRLTAHQRSAI